MDRCPSVTNSDTPSGKREPLRGEFQIELREHETRKTGRSRETSKHAVPQPFWSSLSNRKTNWPDWPDTAAVAHGSGRRHLRFSENAGPASSCGWKPLGDQLHRYNPYNRPHYLCGLILETDVKDQHSLLSPNPQAASRRERSAPRTAQHSATTSCGDGPVPRIFQCHDDAFDRAAQAGQTALLGPGFATRWTRQPRVPGP